VLGSAFVIRLHAGDFRGLEWAFARNWSVKGEYLYVNFGSKTTTATVTNAVLGGSPNLLTTSGTLSANIARAGINYHF
jgi:outer membrane immunogenic protein